MIYKILLIISCVSSLSFCQDQYQPWNEGPYGNNFFDTAGPFELPILNPIVPGDVNFDEVLNIFDLIQIVSFILSSNDFTEEQINIADINNDDTVDILDITSIVNLILTGVQTTWNFENEWNGYESFIFIYYNPSVSGSSALWISDTREALLNSSPMNVHYFFLSARVLAEGDAQAMYNAFDQILVDMSPELEAHWREHLHFCPVRIPELDNWLVDALSEQYALGIDRFQRIKQIGYLGNPATFSGTHMNYLSHEALYYNYEHDVLAEPDEDYYEITVFDETVYSGGWASSISQVVEFPSDDSLVEYDKLQVELLRGCPNGDGNYDDDACDDYDRIAHMYICDEDGSNCYEIARWITPFDRQPHSLTDITPFLSTMYPGGLKTIKFQESGWPNSLLTLKFRFYDTGRTETPREFQPMWNGTVQFNPNYGDNRPPQIFNVPENALKVEFVAYLTGHGWGSAGCYNCCEFCNSKHIFSINGGTYEFERSHPNASDNNYCMELETIAQGVVPNQYGTWGYGRAGWCPGMDVKPYVVDITDNIIIGDENIIDYNACRVYGSDCLEPPVCQGDGYCPEIAFSSYVIIWY